MFIHSQDLHILAHVPFKILIIIVIKTMANDFTEVVNVSQYPIEFTQVKKKLNILRLVGVT